MNQKNKHSNIRIVLLPIRIVLLPLMAAGILFFPACSPRYTVVDQTLEYGEKLEPEMLVKESIEGKEAVLKDPDGKTVREIPEPGVLEVSVLIDGQKAGTSKVTVRDTTAPEITARSDTIQLPVEAAFMDQDLLRDRFQASDLSGVYMSFEDEEVRYGEEGEYPALVVFEDPYGNRSELKIRVVIGDCPDEEPDDSEESEKRGAHEAEERTADAANPAFGKGTVVNGILIVNKKNPISADYAPGDDPAASEAVNRLITDMRSEGLDVSYSTSGFRDYAYQQSLYNSYAARDGAAAADTYSARPGYSEHQTGLTFDLKHNDGSLITRNPEAEWLMDHAAEYGFIIRYPLGKEAITGYDHEPWHLRYVGREAAKKIMAAGQTLEEYLGVEGGDYAK